MARSKAQKRDDTWAVEQVAHVVGKPAIELSAAVIYRTKIKWPSSKGDERVLLVRYVDEGGETAIGVAGPETWTLSVPNFDSLRKSQRERERSILRLFVGRHLYGKRKREPDEAVQKRAEAVLNKERKRDYWNQVEIFDAFKVGRKVHVILEAQAQHATWTEQRFVNQSGRGVFIGGQKTLPYVAEHAVWYLLALEHGDIG